MLGHPPPCMQILLWDLMNELLNVIGCCCPPPRHPFLLPSDTRGNARLPPCHGGFSILPPQWQRWNTVPAVVVMKYGSRILLFHWQFIIFHLFSLSLSLLFPLSTYLYISIHCSLLSVSYTRVYYYTHSLVVCVTYFSPTLRHTAADYSLTATNATRDL